MGDRRLGDKVCIVTGSTGGIGKAIAEVFAEHGGTVAVSGRNEANGKKVVDGITAGGHSATFIRCDVGVDNDVESLVSETVDRFGGLDVLVNNAAATEIAHGDANDVASLTPQRWDEQIHVNLRAVYYVSHLSIPHIRNRGGGTIVNISSVGGSVVWPKAAAYLASKGAINQLTRSMAVDYAADNIRVNALCPGWVLTPVEEKRVGDRPGEIEKVCRRMGIQRMGTAREMGYAALFLACEESSYVTGTTLIADGGWTIQ